MALAYQRDPISGAYTMNEAATGRRQYGAGGTSAATTGPVDKAGYVAREQRRRARDLERQRRLSQVTNSSLGGAIW